MQRSNTMSNIVIVGSGPAGVSAALYAVRAGVQTTVLTKGSGALARAEKIENYYGFAQPVSGPELERRSAIMSQCSCPRSVLSMLHSASVSGQHSSFSSGRWASSSSLESTGFSPCWVRTLAMVPPVVIKSRRCLDIKQKPPVAVIST